jgi:magnesium-protoporphyrin O-methyltransferase
MLVTELHESDSYFATRGRVTAYFDRTAADAWAQLTSDAPLGRIRATVRKGRERMRAQLLAWLPDDLRGARVLDAGCGTGGLALAAARRGANVVATDLSPTLIALARERTPSDLGSGRVDFRVGDMCDLPLARFRHIVAMDSLIHYQHHDIVSLLGQLATRCERSMLITIVPRTPLLAAMHGIGRLFPRRDRAPDVQPIAEAQFRRAVAKEPTLRSWRIGRTARVSSGFYTSFALELVQ